MKKVIIALCTAMLVAVLAFAMTGCSKAGSIVKAYENEGYTVSETKLTEESKTMLKSFGVDEEALNDAESWALYTATKGLAAKPSMFVKFPSASTLKDAFTSEDKDGNKDTAAYDKLVSDNRIKGDCLYISLIMDSIFKNA